jgi:uncharacterized membrane protein
MNKTGKIIRIIAIILMGLTAAMNILGGVGTTCAAFSNKVEYRMAFKDLLDYRWLYQIFVVTTILIGIAGVWALIRLIRGGSNVYRDALIVLGIGTLIGGVHYFTSLALRGKAAPANVKFYVNILTLLVFLLFKIPALREKVDFSKAGGKAEIDSGIGMAAIIVGTIMLTIFHWAGPSHTFFGENWVYVLQMPLIIVGTILTLGGLGVVLRVVFELAYRESIPANLEFSKGK